MKFYFLDIKVDPTSLKLENLGCNTIFKKIIIPKQIVII